MSQLEYERGFNWKTTVIIALTGVIFVPTVVFLMLTSGAGVAGTIAIINLVIFNEFFRRFGSPLRKQEASIIYLMMGQALSQASSAILLVQRGFIVTSPLSRSFVVGNLPMSHLIPYWWAPPIGSTSYADRTFFHPDWIWPILIGEGFWWSGLIMDMVLTLIGSYIFVEVQKLPFPFAQVDASLINTLTERSPSRMKWFTLSIYPGFFYAAILYLPFMMGRPIIPLPWLDLTPWTGKWLPASLIGITTDLSSYVFGFLISFNDALYMLIGSIAIWVVGNTLTVTTYRNVFPAWSSEYFQGLSLAAAWQRSTLRVWFAPLTGFSLALATFVIIRNGKLILGAFRSLSKIGSRGMSDYPRLVPLIIVYVACSLFSVFLFQVLVPGIPIWISLIISLGLSFLNAIIGINAVGSVGFGISIPNPWNLFVYMNGYRGVNAWIQSPAVAGTSSVTWTSWIKVGRLTDTKPIDIILALIFTIALFEVLGIIVVDFYWKMAPIPSSMYPYALQSWPVAIVSLGVWVTNQISIQPWLLYGSFLTCLAVLFAGHVLNMFIPISFSAVALVTGLNMIPPSAISIFVGSALDKFLLPMAVGKETWKEVRSVVVAGIMAGESIVVGLGVAVILIGKSVWIWPW